MKLYTGQVPAIADDILAELIASEAIEVLDENRHEVRADIEAVLKEWIRMDRDLTDQARDIASRDRSTSIGRAKSQLARRHNFKIGDEGLGYIINQLIEMFYHSNNVEEVFAADNEIRKTIRPVISRHTKLDEELDKEVRNKLKNLKEGSMTWDIEYKKLMESLKKSRKLD